MPVNSSSLGQHSLDCRTLEIVVSVYVSFVTSKAFITIPLCVLILYLGLQRWRQQGSFKAVSHSDVFAYHLAAMDLFWGPVFVCYCCGSYYKRLVLIELGGCMFSFCFYGESFFHMLTCLERYLAVVHPITYVGLKNTRGVKIRNISIASTWLLSFAMSCFHSDKTSDYAVFQVLFSLTVSISVITFCSLSVLWVLNRPGPTEGGAEKEQVDPKKRRAFHTITVIATVLWLWFIPFLLSNVVYNLPVNDRMANCLLFPCSSFFSLPSSLASPLLYLHRNGKMSLCFRQVKS